MAEVAHNFWPLFAKVKSYALHLSKMYWATFWEIFSKNPLVTLVNNHPIGEKSSNLVTLLAFRP
jgi:hypothetical protein